MTGYCKCDDGYWGTECNNECPGGVSNPCYENGACDKSTGSCDCYTGSGMNTNCQQCETGWFGTDCSVVHVDNDNTDSGHYLGKCYHSGHFITFDGAVYNYHYPGEHMLVSGQLVSGMQIKIHILQVFMSEYYSSVGTSAVGIQIGSHKLVISVIDKMVSTWYDSEKVVIGSGLTISGVLCKQISSYQYQVVSGSEITINVYVYENHLDVYVGTSATFCGTSNGLLSSCNQNHEDDFKTRTGVVLTSTGTLNTNSIHNDFGQSWIVSDADSIFNNLLSLSNGGGYGLFVNGSNLITEPIWTFTEFVATIEIKFKADIVTSGCYTIWSYKKDEQVFTTVVCDGQLTIYYQDRKITFPSLAVDVGIWYHFALVWRLDTRVIHLYLVQEGLQINTDVVLLETSDPNPLVPGGTFMIGQWNYPANKRDGVNWDFKGVFDDFRIWKKQLTVNQIRSYAFIHMTKSYNGLSNHWNFNLGYGRYLTDSIRGLQIVTVTEPWLKPAWILVDYKLSLLDLNIYQVFRYPTNVNQGIDELCKTVIMSAIYNSSCSAFGRQVQTYFYKQCIFDGYISKSQDWTMEAIITLSDHCSLNREQITWPARTWCSTFTSRHFPRWSGSACSTPCVSGDLSVSCDCYSGYWGTYCQNICPFSASLPCGGGTCFANNGTCGCLSNFVGSVCDSCSTGWNGADCSVSVAEIPSSGVTTKMCSLFGYSHYTLFDGQTFSMDATGEFLFVQDAAITVYIRQMPCGENGAVCVKQVWIQADNQNFTVVSSVPGQSGVSLLHNGQSITLDNIHNLTSTVKVVQDGQSSINIEYGTNILTIGYHSSFLEVFAKFTQCTMSMSGLCGTCDLNRDNDFVTATGSAVSMSSITKQTINSKYADYWRMTTNLVSAFQYQFDGIKEPQNTNGNTFVLAFNGTGAYTSQIDNMYGSNGDATIQVRFAANSDTGLIMAYYKGSSVAIYLNKTVHILWGDQVINTEYTVQHNVWYQVSLSYIESSHNLKIYIITTDGMQWWRQLTVQTSGVLQSGGILKIGEWKENAPLIFDHFTGRIAEIQTWKVALNIYKILYTSRTIMSKKFTDLTTLWIFSKGYGIFAKDLISNYQLILPSEDVYWLQSDLITDGNPPSTPVDTDLKDKAKEKCKEYLIDSTLPQICSKLGDSLRQYYYDACVEDIVSSSNGLGYIYALSSYIEYCEKIVDPPTSPRTSICTDITHPYFTQLCSHLCAFGEINDDLICECSHGYWGEDCSKVCIGGTISPCHDNGFCDKDTGKCYCYPSFSNKTDCTTCLEPWTGNGCDVISPDVPPTLPSGNPPIENHTCSMFGHGHLRNFHDAQFNFIHAGEFYVLKSADVDLYPEVQLRNTYCYDNSICMTAIALRYKNSTIVIRASYYDGQDTLLWINGQSYNFYGQLETQLDDVLVKHQTKSEFEIRTKNGNHLTVFVRSLNQQLNVIVKTESPLCESKDQLCGSCNRSHPELLTFSNTWSIEEVHSLFTVMFVNNKFMEMRPVATAGYCVYFRNSILTTDFLPNVITSGIDFSIEFFIRPAELTGVVLTYNSNKAFLVYLDTTLKLKINQSIYDTELNVTLEHWHHVTLVWQHVASQMVVYVYKEDGSFEYVSFSITNTNMFMAYGYIGFGHPPRPPLTTDTEAYHRYYTGDLDEVRIWHKALSYNDVLKYQMHRIEITEIHLIIYWKFDNYGSSLIYDKKGEHHIQVVDYGIIRQKIQWRISSLSINPPTVPYFHTYTSLAKQQEADSKCTSLVYQSILGTSTGPSKGTLSFYFAACTSDMAGANHIDMSLSVVINLADLYITSGWKTSWPGAVFCNEFKSLVYPGWAGTDCSLKCDFHNTVNTTICTCETGYWGASCNQRCNSGEQNTCNGQGVCDQTTGECKCQMNWAGQNCTTCATGWYGEDCSVAVQPVPSGITKYLCGISGDGHITTIDGASFRFQEHGIYTFYQHSSVNVQVLTGSSRYFETCVTGIAIKISTKVITISTVNEGRVEIDGQVTSLGHVIDIFNGYKIGPLDAHVYKIYNSAGFELVIYVQEGYINVHLSVTTTFCSSSEGLVGACQQKSHSCNPTDYACLIRYQGLAIVCTGHNIPSTSILSFVKVWHHEYTTSIFSQVTSGYSPSIGVEVNGGWISTIPFDKTFIGVSTTIETRIKINGIDSSGNGGTVLSYSWRKTFAVCIIGGQFHVQYGTLVTSTSILVQTGQWTQISLVYNSVTGWITFHYIYNTDMSIYTSIHIGLDVLPARGTLVIGQWQPPIEGGGTTPLGTFFGSVERLLVWNRPCVQSQIFLHWKISITHITMGLVLGFNFETGYGSSSTDFVTNHRMTISETGCRWIIIPDLPVIRTSIATVKVNIGIPDTTYIDKCTGLIQNNKFTSQCGQFTDAAAFYIVACIEDISRTGLLDFGMDSTVAFGSICEVEKGLASPPYQALCNDFTTRKFPVWKGTDCSVKCIFGKFILETSYCECNSGYWGTYCDKECPGGSDNPCNGHGTCHVESGTCACLVNWKGDSNCGSCTTGYTGNKCEVEEPELPPNPPLGCFARKKGYYTNFTGHGMTHDQPGNYKMLEMNNLLVEVSFISRRRIRIMGICCHFVVIQSNLYIKATQGNLKM